MFLSCHGIYFRNNSNVHEANCPAILDRDLFPYLDGTFAMLNPEQKEGLLNALHSYKPGLRHEDPNSVAYDLGFPETIATLEPGAGVPEPTQQALKEAILQVRDNSRRFAMSRHPINEALTLLEKYGGKFSKEQLNEALLTVVIKWIRDTDSRSRDELKTTLQELTRQGASADQILDDIDSDKHKDKFGECFKRYYLPFDLLKNLTFKDKPKTLSIAHGIIEDEIREAQSGPY